MGNGNSSSDARQAVTGGELPEEESGNYRPSSVAPEGLNQLSFSTGDKRHAAKETTDLETTVVDPGQDINTGTSVSQLFGTAMEMTGRQRQFSSTGSQIDAELTSQ